MARSTVVWFRRDLRLADNPALAEAVARGGGVVALFVVDPALWDPAGANRRWFLVGALRALDADMGGALIVRVGQPCDVVTEVAQQVGAGSVVVAEDFGPHGRHRDNLVESRLAEVGVELVRVGSPYAVEPGRIRNQAGDPYQVFTPFSKAWRRHGWPDPISPPERVEWLDGIASEPLPAVTPTASALPQPGEAAARRRLDAFVNADVERYGEQRDLPGIEGTSRLSPYLKWGCIHPRQVLARLGTSAGDEAFRSQLAWREFYADVLLHRPESARMALREKMRGMRVDSGPETDELFEAWCEGRTGYPIVDAGMRQLRAEGWMHNRVRMIAASFLVKDLHLDWTRGARYFMAHLVDGDLASNQHGWQWVAGTGTDAAPYFRVFNPTSQSKKFDPRGDYVRRWVPELAIGDETDAEQGYPTPIVDHAEERAEALGRYEELSREGAP